VLCAEEGKKTCRSGAEGVGISEPVGSAAGQVGLVVVAGDDEGRDGQLRERRVHEGEVLRGEGVQVGSAGPGRREEDAGVDAAV
jgi:hypothetical protein